MLSDVDLRVPAGRTVALVGATGSGKSTVASLVAKLYLPTAGRIAVDGRDLAGVSGPSLRRHIACVTQDNFLYSGTVADNIRVGRPDASDADVRAAARALDVEQLIDALPGGFAAEVGALHPGPDAAVPAGVVGPSARRKVARHSSRGP